MIQKILNADFTWYANQGRFGLRIDLARQNSGLPGSLSMAQFIQDPTQTNTPADFGIIDTNRVTAFAEQRFGDWEAVAELSHRERTASYSFSGFPSAYNGNQTQFSPRLRNLSSVNGMSNEFIVGADFSNWDRYTQSSYSLADATQRSEAIYVRDEVKVGPARIAAGVRHEVFDKTSVDLIGTDNYALVQGVNAWELQGSYAATPVLTVFTKVGQSYRVANVDDNSGAPLTIDQSANIPLLPQISHDLELGATLGNAAAQFTARAFRHNLTNEIYYNPLTYTNVNLDPTRRQGVSLEGHLRLNSQFRVTGPWNYVDATFVGGSNAGNQMALVPKNTVTVHVSWLPGDGQSANVGAQWVDKQQYGDQDFSNSCSAMIPSYATLDARYAKAIGAWEFAVAGTNLTDKHYFSNAYACMDGIYPSDARQLKISARYNF